MLELSHQQRPLARRSEGPLRLTLRFGPAISAKVRSRIDYAFRVFAAVYGHQVCDTEPPDPSVTVVYAPHSGHALAKDSVYVPALYRSEASAAAPAPKRVARGPHELPLFFGVSDSTGQPDWLGEMFQWLSSSSELSATSRDDVGRIPAATA